MKFASSWRLSIALAAIALFAAFAAWPGAGPRTAEADVTSVTPASSYGSDGSTINVDIVGTAGVGATLTVSASGTSTVNNSADICNDGDADCGANSGGPAAAVTWAAVDGAYTATVALTLDCSSPTVVTVTAVDDGASDSATVFCVPSLGNEDVEIQKQSSDHNDDYTFDWDASGGDCLVIADDGTVDFDDDGSFELEDNDDAHFYCESSVNLTIDERDDDDFVRIDDCDHEDGVDISGSSAEFDISDLDANVFCTWENDEGFHAPATSTTGQAAAVSVVLTTGQIDCGHATLVQVLPRSSSGGPAAAGTTIVLTSSLGGTFEPSSVVTSLFPVTLASFLYTAPKNVSGITSITARAGNVQTTAVLQIVCEVAPATTVAPLSPPSAGSGGLLGSSNTGYLPAALAIAAAAAVLGLTAATRRFAAVSTNADGISLPGPATSARQPGGFALLASFVMLVVALLARRWR